MYATYSCSSADSSIVSVSSKKMKDPDSNEYYLKGLKKGQTELTIYEEYKGRKTAIGTVTANVNETISKGTAILKATCEDWSTEIKMTVE